MAVSSRFSTPASLERWRNDTPGCAHRVHLNNAGAALMPQPVIDAITRHVQLEAEMGGYEAADARQPEIDDTYAQLARLVGAAPRNIAIVASATAGFVQALSAFDFQPGDAIVTSRSDYTSYQIAYLSLAKRLGVEVLHADELPEGGIDPESVRQLVRRARCRLVSVSWVPTHSGLVQDVEGVGRVCEEAGVPYHVDACQAIGQIPIDVERLRCDYLSVTARKFLRGPRGIGFLYVSDRALSRGDYPLFVDMRGATWVAPDRFEPAESARRFEDWEFPYALVLGLGAAAHYALDVGIDVAHERAFALAGQLRARLSQIPGVRVLDRGHSPSAIVTAAVASRDAGTIVHELRARRINTAATLQWFGLLDLGPRHVESAVRISPHYYNTEEEIASVVEALAEMTKRG